MFTGSPDGSIVERPDHSLRFFTHTALTYTHPSGMPCVIDSAPPRGAQIRPRDADFKLTKGSQPSSIQEQRRRIDEALGRRDEPWYPLSANCQQFTSSVVTGVPHSPAVKKAALLFFVASCIAIPFLFTDPGHS